MARKAISTRKSGKAAAMRMPVSKITADKVIDYWPADRAKVMKTLMTREGMSYSEAVTWSRRYMKRGVAV